MRMVIDFKGGLDFVENVQKVILDSRKGKMRKMFSNLSSSKSGEGPCFVAYGIKMSLKMPHPYGGYVIV